MPTRVEDSWGNWALNVTTNTSTRRITALSLDGVPGRVWTYVQGTHLTRVDTPLGTWRTYQYAGANQPSAWWRLITVRDALNNVIESHAYEGGNTGRALNSQQITDDIDSIGGREAGRNPSEYSSTIVYKNGRIEKHYKRWIASAWRTVEVDGGCTTCGTRYSSVVYDTFGNVIRAQSPDGYIVDTTYDAAGQNVLTTRTAMRPSTCDPATAADHCRLTTDALQTGEFTPTTSTVETTHAYDDPNWPQYATETRTASVLDPTSLRYETTAYDPATGQAVLGSVRGWTGDPLREETRTTVTSLYDGAEGAAFAPGGAFDAAWLALPQPRMRKQVDGPRTDAADVTHFVYYPIDPSVPARLRGQLATVRNAAGHVERFEDYDEYGNARRTVDANGVVLQRTYDVLGRLTASTVKGVPGCDTLSDPLCNTDVTQTRTFNGAGPLTSEQHASGVTAYQYDTRSRVATMSRGLSVTDLRERIEYQYDTLTGHKSLERWLAASGGTWAERKREAYVYDLAARLERITHADGASVAYAYDPMNRVVSARDENHASPNTSYVYDPDGRVVEVVQTLASDPDGEIHTLYGYDAHGNLTSVTDPNGNVTTYRYDDFGQMLSQVSPVTGTTAYTYDLAGQLTEVSDANGAVTTRTYDVLGRVLTSSAERLGAVEETAFAYDAGTFGVGRLTSMTDPTGSTQYTYDRRGQLLSEQKTIGASFYTTAFRYDADGNRTRIIYPSGHIADTAHDYAGRPASMVAGAQSVVTSAAYLPFGPPSQIVFGNGTTRAVTYDNRYRLSTNVLTGPAGAIASYQYGYDPAGNITSINDVLEPAYNRTFGYDDLGRLTNVGTGAVLWGAGTYSYDAMGNLQAKTLGTSNSSFTYDGTTPRITSVVENGTPRNVTYDPAGNELAAGTWPSSYSPRNHLQQSGTVTYDYDGRGIRVRAVDESGQGAAAVPLTAPAEPTARASDVAPVSLAISMSPIALTTSTEKHFLYTPELNLMAEATVTGGQTAIDSEYLWFAGQPVAQFETTLTPAVHYYLTDHLGTPVLTTSSTGAVDWRIEREPYGETYVVRTGASRHQPLAFPGQEESGGEVRYNIFRWYRAGWGRYTQTDPGFTAGRSEYSYALDNPLIFVDRDGREPAFGNNDQTKCLLCTVYAESRGQSKACQWAVASVIINRVRKAQEKGKPASICSIVSAPGQFDGYNNKNYQQCANGCLPAWPPELQDTFSNFQNGFPVNPEDATFFGNNTPAMSKYFGTDLGLTKVPFPSCPVFQFYKE